MQQPRKQLLWSLSFLAASIAIWFQVAPLFTPLEGPVEEKATVTETECSTNFVVEGVWEQYAIENGERIFMARLDIRSQGTDFVATPTSLAADVYPKHQYRSFDHNFENGTWTFKESWDDSETGHFALEQTCEGSFRGFAVRENSGSSFETVFVKVGE